MRTPTSSILFVAAVAVSASATSYREVAQVTSLAPVDAGTVTGWVRGVRAERSGHQISSRITLELEATNPSDPPMLEFLSPGGTIDGVAMRVSGAPSFAVGEHVRVTIRATRQGLRLAGLASGKVVLP